MSDLIKRSDAIEAIENTDWYHINRNGEMVHGANDELHQAWQKADEIHKAIESIPSAERKGEWVLESGALASFWVCSECGISATVADEINDIKYFNFCPNCGARMFAKDTIVPNKKGADDD